MHTLGGGIGLGAAIAEPATKTVALVGDGGLMLGIVELITAVEVKANIVFVLMNDRGYGVIKNIQDAQYEGRHQYSELQTADFPLLCKSPGSAQLAVGRVEEFAAALDDALANTGPVLLEVEMTKIGMFAQQFAGPPAGAAGKG